jgi:hypothetical protein
MRVRKLLMLGLIGAAMLLVGIVPAFSNPVAAKEDSSFLRKGSQQIGSQSAFMPYIVVVLESIKIGDDTDPAGPGEIVLVTLASSGGSTQNVKWPVSIWHEADNGNILLGSDDDRNGIPIFALREDQMSEDLLLSITAIDNDDIPGWLDAALPPALGAATGALVFWQTGEPGASVKAAEKAKEIGDQFTKWLKRAETIGTFANKFRSVNDWGVRDAIYQSNPETINGKIEVTYSIRRITIPNDMKARVQLQRIKTHESGDFATGEVFMHTRVASNIAGEALDARIQRFPKAGHHSMGDGATWSNFGPNAVLYDGPIGPFLYLEVGVWDEDNPGVGDDHDMLGILAQRWHGSELSSQRTVTISERRKGKDEGDVTIELILDVNCVPKQNLTLNNATISGTAIFRAQSTITVGQNLKIAPNGDVTLRASKEVRLLPGFSTEKGSRLHVEIVPNPCS